jgi:hypothetical protein
MTVPTIQLNDGTVDLFLIHWPLPTLYGGDFVSTWRTVPVVNQIELPWEAGRNGPNPDEFAYIPS